MIRFEQVSKTYPGGFEALKIGLQTAGVIDRATCRLKK